MRCGFIAVGMCYVNTYEVATVKSNHAGGCELCMSNGQVVYCKETTPGDMMERIYEAREGCEAGR